ncbi:MAG: hypothetical protein U1F11_04160 [Steroidobacteraceae bacterium]
MLKTAWWPFAPDRPAPLPVWDPQLNPVRAGGNDYTGWRRIVLVDPRPRVEAQDVARPDTASAPTAADLRADPTYGAAVDFAGHRFANPRRVPLRALYSVPVDAALASSAMRDPEARRAALLALGRELRAGDVLALVALHVATRELHDWTWATWWWHDEAHAGPYAHGRPEALDGPWRNYLMQVAFDDATPAAADGGAHVCFNPWLEARFPDGGNGGGTRSNCLACHRRASYPPVPFLPVTRGPPQRGADPAYEAGRLRTSFLWSIPLRAAP